MAETILIVDDEDSVRRTLRDWLTEANLGAEVLVASDAEAALAHAGQTVIDLAVLDWNLGTGNDGLQLLEDLSVFHPDVIAILVTGYAHQATPLAALRMGVRDYLDKSRDLTRESFVAAVRKQLERIAPAKRVREWNLALAEFRGAVEQVLPLVRSTAALTEAAPLPEAAAALCGFLKEATGATDAVLLIRIRDESGESCRAYATDGTPLTEPLAPFAKSLAANALGMQEPCVVDLEPTQLFGVDLHPFERGKKSLLVAPLAVGGNVTAVLELFDKPGPGFTAADRRLASAAAAVGSALLRQVLAERQTQQSLFAAVEAALKATDGTTTMAVPAAVRESLTKGMDRPGATVRGGMAIDLAEAVQALSARHGDAAVKHCLRMVESLTKLLDDATR